MLIAGMPDRCCSLFTRSRDRQARQREAAEARAANDRESPAEREANAARLAGEAKAKQDAEVARLAAEEKAKQDAQIAAERRAAQAAAEAKAKQDAEVARLAAEEKATQDAQIAAERRAAQASAEAKAKQDAANKRLEEEADAATEWRRKIAEARIKGEQYGDKSEFKWSLSAIDNPMTDDKDYTVASAQPNGSGAIANVEGTCPKPGRVTFVATLNEVTDPNSPLGLPDFAPGYIAGNKRINDDPQFPARFPAQKFRNSILVSTLLSLDPVESIETTWRVLAQVETARGPVIIQIPMLNTNKLLYRLPGDWSEFTVMRSRPNLIGAQKSLLGERLLECDMLLRAELRFAKGVARQPGAKHCRSGVVGIENAIYVCRSDGPRTRNSKSGSEKCPAEYLTHSLSSLLFLCQ